MKERKYSILKVSLENGETQYIVRREHPHWLTGRPVVRYWYDDFDGMRDWTRHISWAWRFVTETAAMDKIKGIIHYDHQDIVKMEDIKDVYAP